MSIPNILKRILKWITILFIMLFIVQGFALQFLLQIPFQIAFGWIPFLRDNFAAMEFNPLLFAEMAVCIVILGVGGHGFTRWLYRWMMPEAPSAWRPSWTIAGLGAVLLLFIVGIAVIGIIHQTVWLLTSQEGWIEDSSLYRAKLFEGIHIVTAVKSAVSEYRVSNGRFPDGNAEANLISSGFSHSSKYVRSVDVGQGGVVTLTFTATVASPFSGKTLTFTPTMVPKQVAGAPNVLVDWSCSAGTLDMKWRPAKCR